MITVGAGEEVVITKHGKAIARLVGAQAIDADRARQGAEKLKTLSRTTTLDGLSWKALRDEGRR